MLVLQWAFLSKVDIRSIPKSVVRSTNEKRNSFMMINILQSNLCSPKFTLWPRDRLTLHKHVDPKELKTNRGRNALDKQENHY